MRSWEARPAWQLPVQWPDGGTASDARPVVRERMLKAAIFFAMLGLTVFDRFGLSLTERAAIPAAMMAMYALLAAMLLGGAAQLNFRATVAYLAIASVATISILLNAPYTPLPFLSKMSLLFLVVLYAPFCVSLRHDAVAPELWRWTLRLFIAFAVFLGVAGIVQYAAQFVFHPEWLFDFTPLIPERLRGPSGFNTEYEIYSSAGEVAWTKSNGFFMREPSIFSVVMAFGLLCELSMDRRRWIMAILAAGLGVSHAMSGLVCLAAGLAAGLAFPLDRGKLARAVAFALLAAGVIFVFKDTQNVRIYLDRSDELVRTRSGNSNTSAYCRFVASTAEVVRHINRAPWTSVVGNGPGSMARMAEGCAQKSSTYAKILFEYGLAGTLAFGFLIIGALNRSSAPLRIAVGAGVAWVLLGGNLLDALYLLFIYIVSAMWPEGTAGAGVTAPSIAPDMCTPAPSRLSDEH